LKKIMFSVLIGLSLLLSSCESFNGFLDEILPAIELEGDYDVTIGLNAEYTDPGYKVIGEFELEVETISDLDTTKYGTYYITYSADFEGKDIYVERKIRVVPKTELDFNLEYELSSADPFSLTFSISIDDEAGDLKDGLVKFYRLDEQLDEQSFSNGTNVLVFDGLENQTFYRIEVTGSYIFEGVEYTLDNYDLGGTTTIVEISEYPRLELIGDSEITLAVGEEYVEQGVTIINDRDFEVEIESNVNIYAPGTYTVVYTTVFNQATIYAHRTVIVEGETMADFNVNIEVVENGGYTLGFTVSVDDEDELIESLRGVLYLGEDEVSSIQYVDNSTIMAFNSLLDDTLYRFELVGTYLVDGNSVSIGEYQLEVTTNEVNSLLMFILNGDSEMEIELNSTFEDPGAQVLGGSDIEISVLSNLDISEVGNYEIRYSAIINGSVQELIRAIEVVNSDVPSYEITLSLDQAMVTSLTYSVDLEDPTSKLFSTSAVLYLGTEEVSSVAYSVGENTIKFEGLSPNTSYKLVLRGMYYDDETSSFASINGYELIESTIDDSLPVFTIEDSEILIQDIDFLINSAYANGEITSMSAAVYDNSDDYQEVIWSLDLGETSVQFDFLRPETSYRLVAEFTYLPEGETVAIEGSYILLNFTTLSPPKPVLKSFSCGLGEDYVLCTAEWDELEQFSDVYYSGTVYKDGEFVSFAQFTNNGTSLFFEGLTHGTTYDIEIYSSFTVIETGKTYGFIIYEMEVHTILPGSEPEILTK